MTIAYDLQQALRALRVLHEQKAQELANLAGSIQQMERLIQDLPEAQGANTEVTDKYAGLSIPGAARAYLTELGRPAQTADIADALLAGGIRTSARNFSTTVYSILREASGFTRRQDGLGWDLADRVEDDAPAGVGAAQ